MELLVVVLIIALLVGLILRKKEDNTMETLSKGCGCLIFITLCILVYIYWIQSTNP